MPASEQHPVPVAERLQCLHLIARPDSHAHGFVTRLREVDEFGRFGVERVAGVAQQLDDGGSPAPTTGGSSCVD